MKGETLEAAMIIEQMSKALPGLEARGLLTAARMPLMHALVDVIAHDRPVELDFDRFFGS